MANTLKLGNGKWATGKDTVLAFNDTNNNFKPLPFSFSRASSATVVNQSGLIETVGSGTPRIDFLGNTKGALLLEPSRTNLIPYSENVLLWSTIGTVVRQGNVSISPDGTQTAGTITSGNDTSFNRITQSFSVSANSTCTASLFIKKVQTETNYLGLGIVFSGGTTDVAYVSFDSVNGIARNMDSRITAILNVVDYGTYWRLEATATDSGSNTQVEMSVYPTLSINGTIVSPGASSVRTIWGMQLELNSSYATSYIPTSGSAVTRVVDKCISAGNNQVIKSTEGTIYAEQKSLETNFTYNYFVAVSDGTNNNRLEIRQTATGLQFLWRVGGTYQSQIVLTNAPFTSVIKFALRYSSANIKFYVNGSLVGTLNSPTLYASGVLKNIEFADGSGGTNFRGTVKDLKYYNTALTDQELIALTTI